jgi:hypothetical protein
MLQFSPPAQAGYTAAVRKNTASTIWTHRVAEHFIPLEYKNIVQCMSTAKPVEIWYSKMILYHRSSRTKKEISP